MSILRVTAVVDICVDGSWFNFVNIIELPRHSRCRGRYKGRSYTLAARQTMKSRPCLNKQTNSCYLFGVSMMYVVICNDSFVPAPKRASGRGD